MAIKSYKSTTNGLRGMTALDNSELTKVKPEKSLVVTLKKNGGWDGCSTGGHLHLQTATGVYMTDYYTFGVFQSRSFNPTTIVNMPAFHEYFSGR